MLIAVAVAGRREQSLGLNHVSSSPIGQRVEFVWAADEPPGFYSKLQPSKERKKVHCGCLMST